MIKKQLRVNIENGLHARPAAELVKVLSGFQSDVHAIKNGQRFNLKSIIHIMSTSIEENEVLTVEIDGADESEVLMQLETFFNAAS